jgi:hypothetical protein
MAQGHKDTEDLQEKVKKTLYLCASVLIFIVYLQAL